MAFPLRTRSARSIHPASVIPFFLLCAIACTNEPTETGPVDIGAEGGEVATSNGATVSVPPGALTADTTIAVQSVDAESVSPFPTGTERVSEVFAFTPHGTVFESPVAITVQYTAAGTSALQALRLDGPDDTTWEPVNEASFQNGVATLETTSFSFYAVAATPEGGSGAGGAEPGAEPLTWQGQAPHLRMVGTREGTTFDTDLDEQNATIQCLLETNRADVEFVGPVADGLGNITFKFKDVDLTAQTAGEPLSSGFRLEWELKSPEDVTLCDQGASPANVTLELVPDASGGTIGGLITATFDEITSVTAADVECPVATIEASFSAPCSGAL